MTTWDLGTVTAVVLRDDRDQRQVLGRGAQLTDRPRSHMVVTHETSRLGHLKICAVLGRPGCRAILGESTNSHSRQRQRPDSPADVVVRVTAVGLEGPSHL